MRKFYCQDCGVEVPIEVDTCPNCNKHFDSVLCPKCSFTGSAVRFRNGCPKCGYLATPDKIVKEHKQISLSLKLFLLLFSLLIITLFLMLYIF